MSNGNNQQTKTRDKDNVRETCIAASPELWEKFDLWMKQQGCQTLAEGIRTAMRQVTQFDT